MSTARKQLHVNLFEMNCVGHISHGLWVHPRNTRHRFNELSFWTELAQVLEDGCFDAVFLADVIGTYDGFRGGPQTALREAVQIPDNDPLSVISAMAVATEHLGFAATFSTTYEPPFAFARRMSTLDHLTAGRVAWNVVTSYLPNAARNFGLPDEIDHDLRYEIADEYLDVLHKLWEGSWDDDAVVVDRDDRVYTDPEKVRYIDHVGKHYSVAGPHLSQPSPQRTPVIYRAGSSEAGRAFAARHAEAVFVGGRTLDEVRAITEDIRQRSQAAGRGRQAVKFTAGAAVIVGRTEQEVAREVEEFKQLRSIDGHLTHAGAGPDWTRYSAEDTIADLVARKVPGYQQLNRHHSPEQTVGQVLQNIGRFDHGAFFVAGTPRVVADQIERWLDEGGIDGIDLRQFLTPHTASNAARTTSAVPDPRHPRAARALLPQRHGVVVLGMVHAGACGLLTPLAGSRGDHHWGTATVTGPGADEPQASAHSPLRARPATRARFALLALVALLLAGAALAVRDEPAAAPPSAADELAQDVAQRVVDDVQDHVSTGRVPGELDPAGAAAAPLSVDDVHDWLQDPPATYWKDRSRQSWRVLSNDVPAPAGSTPPAQATFVLAVYLLAQDTSFVNTSEWGRACLRLHVEPAAHLVQQQRVECADDVPDEGPTHH